MDCSIAVSVMTYQSSCSPSFLDSLMLVLFLWRLWARLFGAWLCDEMLGPSSVEVVVVVVDVNEAIDA